MVLNYVAFVSLVIGSVGLVIINFFARGKTPRDNLVQGNIALISGLLFLFSILSDWVLSGEQIIPGPDIEKLFPETPIIDTSFNFMFVFAALTIIGGTLLVSNYEIGRKLIYYSGRLSITFSLFFIIIFSSFPMTRPYWMAYITLIISVIILISIYISHEK